MVGATFENDLDEMSRRWELLKLIYGCVLRPDVIPLPQLPCETKRPLGYTGYGKLKKTTCDLRLHTTLSALQESRVIRITKPFGSLLPSPEDLSCILPSATQPNLHVIHTCSK